MKKKAATKKRPARRRPGSDAPAHLGAEGQKLWDEHRPRTTDLRTLEMWCATYERWLQARADVKKNGMTLSCINERGQDMVKANPACNVEVTSARIMMACQRKLGSAAEEETKGDAFSKFDGM